MRWAIGLVQKPDEKDRETARQHAVKRETNRRYDGSARRLSFGGYFRVVSPEIRIGYGLVPRNPFGPSTSGCPITAQGQVASSDLGIVDEIRENSRTLIVLMLTENFEKGIQRFNVQSVCAGLPTQVVYFVPCRIHSLLDRDHALDLFT